MKRFSAFIACVAAFLGVMTLVSWLAGGWRQPAANPAQTAQQAASADQGTMLASPAQADNGANTVTISVDEYARFLQLQELMSILQVTEQEYYQEVDTKALLQGAAAGMLSALKDPYSFYYTPEDFAKMWEEDAGEYVGVGMLITSNYKTNICTVSRVYADSPALKAGVRRGDILYKLVEPEMLITPENIDDVVTILRGQAGTEVTITVLRGGEELTFTMTRAQVKKNDVESMMLTGDVGYILLDSFSEKSSTEMTSAVDSLIAQGAQGIILDLRDNPGGWLDEAQKIADLFVDEGTLCYLEYRDGTREYTYTTNGHRDVALTILVNENSASAAELTTGCLKERAGATVVGVQTYGKGVVQAVMNVGYEGAGMQITIAQYFTPCGNAVHQIGITPDVVAAMPEDDYTFYLPGDLNDPQLAIAMRVMQEKLGAGLAASVR